jgi:spermidine/putrescine transport system ATP-binding protein
MTMIRLENLRKEFGSTVAVEDVSLTVTAGEFMCLIGPSGSGKTTTLRMVAGFETPTSGKVYLGEREVTILPPHQRSAPMVWQHFVLFPHMNVRQNIEYGLRKRGVKRDIRREKVERAARALGIDGLLQRWTTELSGGEQQRVGLARALVLEPSVLLLDEPMGSLDANLALAIQAELKGIQQRLGITFFYVTHNQSEALAMGDRIAVMNGGIIEQVGSPSEVANSPKTRFVAEFVGRNNVLDGTVSGRNGGYIQIECAVGTVSARVAPAELSGRVAYAVSADHVRLSTVGASSPAATSTVDTSTERLNIVVGTVKGEEYHGAWTLIAVDVNDTLIQANVPSESRPRLGQRVGLSWTSDDALILPAERHGR